MVEVRQHHEHLVSAIVGVPPAFAQRRIEKVCHQTIRVTCHGKLFFQHAGSLKFGQTFQLIAGKAFQKIENKRTFGGSCSSKKSADQ